MASRKDSITGIRSFEDAVRRTGRNNRTLSQQRIYVKDGVPSVNELKDGVPVLRFVQNEGFFQYVKYKGQIYRTKFDSVEGVVKKQPLTPHYDSGWVNIDHSSGPNGYDFTHNLGTKMLLSQVYLRDDSNRIHNVSSTYTDTVVTGVDIGIWLYMETANKISVGTANDKLFITDNTSLGGTSIQIEDGHLRIFLWRIGKSE